jgi:SPP1 family predicted phage head-tail adaptor
MRQRVRLQVPSFTPDSPGSVVVGWSTATVDEWAKVEPLSAAELNNAKTVETQATLRVTTKYNSTATGKHRWAWFDGATTRPLYIQGMPIDPMGLHRETVCFCVERDQ